MKIYIDTNFFIDFFMRREPFYDNAKKLFSLFESGVWNGYLGAHTFTDIFYILRKDYPADKRRNMLRKLSDVLFIVSLDESMVKSALSNTAFKDFEDCLQAECAAACRADYIVTRNVDDFACGKVKAITPEELLKLAEETDK